LANRLHSEGKALTIIISIPITSKDSVGCDGRLVGHAADVERI